MQFMIGAPVANYLVQLRHASTLRTPETRTLINSTHPWAWGFGKKKTLLIKVTCVIHFAKDLKALLFTLAIHHAQLINLPLDMPSLWSSATSSFLTFLVRISLYSTYCSFL